MVLALPTALLVGSTAALVTAWGRRRCGSVSAQAALGWTGVGCFGLSWSLVRLADAASRLSVRVGLATGAVLFGVVGVAASVRAIRRPTSGSEQH